MALMPLMSVDGIEVSVGPRHHLEKYSIYNDPHAFGFQT
jgi:hypothetical protein